MATAVQESSRQVEPLTGQEPPPDDKTLRRDRVKFGICTILDRSEESSLGGIPSVLIRMLGGSDWHIGIYSSTQGAWSLAQFFGAMLLHRLRSNRRAMVVSMCIGFLVASLVAAMVLVGIKPALRPGALWGYLILSIAFFGVCGVQLNIESSWIGDLVPTKRLGWFNSFKWILTTLGVIVFNLVIGLIADRFPNSGGYASVYMMFALSFIAAAVIYGRTTDRVPHSLGFVKTGGAGDRMRYGHGPMWCYIVFYWCWSGGRTAMLAFTSVYLIDHFGFSMTQIAWMNNVQLGVSVVLLYVVGKISDRRGGSRLPLLVLSATVAISMFLWVGSAWLGVSAIIAYQVISGLAGNTHSMAAINLALEIFPEKGRAAYLGFSRLCIGAFAMITPAVAGLLMWSMSSIRIPVRGVVMDRYHLLFAGCTLLTLCCLIPLSILGRYMKGGKVA